MIARLADERGFTLVELLVSMIVGMIVLFAGLALMDGSWRVQARTADSIEATDRGRLAMDRIRQQLDGRVCLNAATATATEQGAVVSATDVAIEFYASVTNDAAPRLVVERRRMTYRPATRDILLESWRGIAPPPTPPPANTATPTRTRVIATGVAPAAGTPIFRYFALASTAPQLPTLQLAPPITLPADRNRVVLLKVNFVAEGAKPNVRTEFQNDSLARSGPTCLF